MSEINERVDQVGAWVGKVFGERSLRNRKERAMRVLEEAVELAQAEGLSDLDVMRVLGHVYGKPADNPEVEGAGVAIALLAWASGTDNDLGELILREINALEARDPAAFADKIAMKRRKRLIVEHSLTPYEVSHR